MKRIWFCFSFMSMMIATVAQQSTITVTNSLPVQRQEVIEIPWQQINQAYPLLDTANFKIINKVTKKELEYQLQYRGEKQIKNLLISLTVPSNGKVELQLVKGKHKSFSAKTYCRYVPERKDDFAWENDRIAFRMYGTALENFPKEMAYGVDVWVKKTDRLILNERYKQGEYHIDHGDGLDYYHVGLTLGAGGIAPYLHDTIWHSKNYRKWEVLDNGPLRTSFRLDYDEWNAAGQKVNVVKTISLDAGSQLSKVEVSYSFEATKALPVVIGIIKRKETGTEWFDENNGIMGYWEPADSSFGTTGVGCVFTQPVQQMMMSKEHLLTITSAKQNEAFVYYNGAAWDKAGLITSSKNWFNYLDTFKQRINQPLKISISKIR